MKSVCLARKSIKGTTRMVRNEDPVALIYFGNRATNSMGGKEKENAREQERPHRATAGWTNSIVVGRLTAIGQRDIFSYQV